MILHMIYFSLSKLTMFQYVRSYLIIWPSDQSHQSQKALKTQDSVSSSLPEVPTPIAEYVVPEDPPMGLAVPANPPPRGGIRLTDFVNEDYLEEENPYADVPKNDSFVQMLRVKQGDNTNANNSAENMDTDDWIFLDKPFINSQRP